MADNEQQQVSKDPRAFIFSSPREERLHGKIQLLLGYGPADFFHDACALMSDPRGLATSAHLVAHLLRDLDNRFKGMLVTLTKAPDPENPDAAAEGKVRVILKALDISEGSEEAQSWLRLARKDYSFAGRAHLRGLGPTLARNTALEEDWKQLLKIYEVVLDRFEKKYSMVDTALDALLAKDEPSADDLKILKEGVPNNEAAYEYFFGRLQKPKWLDPLAKDGCFERIPAPSPSGTHYRCHQLKYLKRMAALPECQKTVIEVLMSVETENIMALCDLAETAVALPPHLAVKTVPKFVQYLETSSYLFVLPFDLGDLTKNLAPDHPKEALELAAALLVIKPQEGAPDMWREPKTRIQTHEYQHALEEAIPPLAESGGLPVLELLCNLLATAVEARRGEGEEREFDDGSYSWRHAIDGYDGVYHSHEITNGLITAVYQTAGKIIAKNASAVGRVVTILDAKRWTIFERITMQLLCDSEDPPPELVAQKLLDEKLWDNDATKREYFQLAEIHTDLLSAAQREEIVRKIEAGPDLEGLEGLEQERMDRLVRGWRWRRLVPFRGILPALLQRECDDLVADLGEPFDEAPSAFARSVSSVSPIDKDELQSKNIEEIVAYLRDWVPTGEWEQPDPDGLSGVLRGAIADEPVRFAEKAQLFAETDPTYVRNVLSGFREAIKAERPFPWEGILKLCTAVLQKPIQIPGRNSRRVFDFDPDWNGARRGIVDLISNGLMEGPASIPFACRNEVWDILDPLTQDPDPASEKETRQNMNPYDEAVNTMRGSAIETVIFYVSWVLREKKITAGPAGRIEAGLQHTPEAEAVLAVHLDRQREPSPLIHTLYGKWLPNLDHTDHEWAERMLPQIFPSDPALQNLRDAAWNTYMLYSGGPYNKTAEMLIPKYRLSVDRIEQTMPAAGRGDLKEALCIHLSYLYLRGILKLDGDDGTIAAFLQRADAKLRGQLVLIMGDIIRHTKEPSREWIERATAFWEARLAAAKTATDRGQHVHEMNAFGYWFVSRKFDDGWALQNLENALKLGSDIEFDYHVLEHLASMAKTRPLECARCLQLIVTSEAKSEWDVRLLVKNAREVLVVIFAGDNAQAKVVANEVVSAFLARGQQDIREPVSAA